MKFDIIRQQVFTSLVTLLVMSVVGMFVLLSDGPHAQMALVENHSLLGGYIEAFQASHNVWAAIISSLLIFSVSVTLGRVVSTQNLFGVSSSIHLPLIGAMLWCVTLSDSYLLTAVVATLSARAISEFILSFRNSNYLGNLFNAAMAISVISLVYTSAAVMWAMVPLILLFVSVTVREWIVAIVGLALPIAITSYVYWLCGSDILEVTYRMYDMFMERSALLDFKVLLLFRVSMLTLAALMTLLSLLWIKDGVYKSRRRMNIVVVVALFSLLTLLSPSATLLSFAAFAPAVAVAMSFAVVNLRGRIANILYFLILALLVAAMFTPLYLPL